MNEDELLGLMARARDHGDTYWYLINKYRGEQNENIHSNSKC